MSTPAWHGLLRGRGYRLTPQRQLVLEAVSRLGHATPDDIAAAVRDVAVGVNISTVYRTLELLEELGLVRHTHLGHRAPTYHLADDDVHVHLVCRRCEAVSEVTPDVVAPVVAALQEGPGFHVDVAHVSFTGLCGACAAASDRADGTASSAPAAPGAPDHAAR